MTHRALLLGAAYGTLYHVPRSLDRLAAALAKYGFAAPERFLDLSAERLLAELTRFVAAVEPGDAVAIVYVGHAGRGDGFGYLRPRPGADAVVGLELGAQLAALIRKTGNVTLVLDACHAAGVVEDPSHLTEDGLRAAIAGQKRRAGGLEVIAPEAPLDAVVQLFAAGPAQNALEDHARACGLFSGALAEVLEYCVGREVTWQEVLDEARLRMRLVDREQAPALGGRHRRRVPFTERESDSPDDIACKHVDGAVHLAAGALAGVAVGDRFALREVGRPLEPAAPTAQVTELGPHYAVLRLAGTAPPADTPQRAVRIAGAAGSTGGAPSGAEAATQPRPALRRLLGALEPAPALPPSAFDIRWGRVEPDGRTFVRLPLTGAELRADDDVWVAVGTRRNEYAFRLHFALMHLRPDGRLVELCPAHPRGMVLAADRHFLLASRLACGLARDDVLSWSKGQPPGEHAVVFLISNKEIDGRAIARSPFEAADVARLAPLACYALASAAFTVG